MFTNKFSFSTCVFLLRYSAGCLFIGHIGTTRNRLRYQLYLQYTANETIVHFPCSAHTIAPMLENYASQTSKSNSECMLESADTRCVNEVKKKRRADWSLLVLLSTVAISSGWIGWENVSVCVRSQQRNTSNWENTERSRLILFGIFDGRANPMHSSRSACHRGFGVCLSLLLQPLFLAYLLFLVCSLCVAVAVGAGAVCVASFFAGVRWTPSFLHSRRCWSARRRCELVAMFSHDRRSCSA